MRGACLAKCSLFCEYCSIVGHVSEQITCRGGGVRRIRARYPGANLRLRYSRAHARRDAEDWGARISRMLTVRAREREGSEGEGGSEGQLQAT